MEQIIIVAVAAIAGGASVWALMEWQVVRPMQQHLRAAHDSQEDTVYLWEQERERAGAELVRLGERVEAERDAADTHASIAALALNGAEYQQRKRREAVRSLEMVLTYYGREVKRADEAEDALRRELVVSAGLERLFGQERAA